MAAVTIVSATIESDGTTLTIVFSEPVLGSSSIGLGGLDLIVNSSLVSLTYVSGAGTDTGIYTVDPPVLVGDVVLLVYGGEVGFIRDLDSEDYLQQIDDLAVTNDSTQTDADADELIDCDAWAFIVDGQDSVFAFRTPAARLQIAVAGPSVGFGLAARISAESGAFLVGGGVYAEGYARAIVGDTGEIELVGNDGLSVGPDVVLEAATGEFDLVGADADVVVGNVFSANVGAFAFTGAASVQLFRMPSAAGVFAVAGQDYAEFTLPFFDSGTGAFVVGGGVASIEKVSQSAAIHIYNHFFIRS